MLSKKIGENLAPIPVFQKKRGEEVTALQTNERDPRILHTELRKRAVKLELGKGNGTPAFV